MDYRYQEFNVFFVGVGILYKIWGSLGCEDVGAGILACDAVWMYK
jgi:hypothetical protein